jgi:hypothetical protein
MDPGVFIHRPVDIFLDYLFLPGYVVLDILAVFPEQPGYRSGIGRLNQPVF